jgi:UMF1 family MFS transporter
VASGRHVAAAVAAPARPLPRVRELLTPPIVGWALYDFANTIFSYAVITRYFNDWITDERGEPDWSVGLMNFVVALALVLTLPVSGAIGDRYGRRKPFLVAFTLLCVGATAALGVVDTTIGALVVAGVAIFAFQNALAHYDPLLADVAPERLRGRVSGIGIGAGYVGVLLALGVLAVLVPEDENQRAFLPTAVMFLVFSLPCFLLVRERRPRAPGAELAGAARAALTQLRSTLATARRYADVGRFLIARFLYVDAIGTVIVFMVVYADRVGELSGAAKSALLGLSVVFAALGALAAGAAVERVGPKRVLMVILGALVVAMLGTAAIGGATVLWVTGPVVGIALGTVWTSDRVFLLRLAPAEYRGEFFGLYGLVGKLSSGVGPLVLWGGTILLLDDLLDVASKASASRVAVAVLAVAALAGAVALRPLSDEPRRWSAG